MWCVRCCAAVLLRALFVAYGSLAASVVRVRSLGLPLVRICVFQRQVGYNDPNDAIRKIFRQIINRPDTMCKCVPRVATQHARRWLTNLS